MLHILHGGAIITQRKISISYIEANPVCTDLVENPEDWKWSSARARRYKEGLVPDDSDIPFLMK